MNPETENLLNLLFTSEDYGNSNSETSITT